MRKHISLLLCVLFLFTSLPCGILAEEEPPEGNVAAVLAEAEEPALADSAPAPVQVPDDPPAPDAPAASDAGSEEPELPPEAEPDGTEPTVGPDAPAPEPDPDEPEMPDDPPVSDNPDAPVSEPEEEPLPDAEPVDPEAPALNEDPETGLLAEGFTLLPVTLSCTGNGRAAADKASAQEGETVTVRLTPDFGHVLSALYLNGEDVTSEVTSGVYAFAMPAGGAVLEISFIPDPALTAFGSCGESALWTLSRDGLLTVSGSGAVTEAPWSVYKEDIVEAAVLSGITVLGSSVFKDHVSLTKVTLPESLREIGDSAFAGCSALTSAALPDGLRKLGGHAFSGCGLTAVALPGHIQAVGPFAFEGCSQLAAVTMPESSGLSCIEAGTFKNCASLAQITLPDTVLTLGASAFSGCRALEWVCLPAYMEELGTGAFYGCVSLTAVTLSDGISVLPRDAFSGCAELASLSLPATMTAIEAGSLSGCTSLTVLYLPERLTRIGADAFSGSGLVTLYYRGTAEQWDAADTSALPEGLEVVCLGAVQQYTAYYVLSPGQQIPLQTEPAELVDVLFWESETPAVCTFENGAVTAVGPGIGYIVGTGEFSGRPLTARIRIDVTESFTAAEEVTSVSLPQKTVTVELYKTNYSRFGVLLNRTSLRLSSGDDPIPADSGVLIAHAVFTDEAAGNVFTLRVVDDATLEVIPTSYALEHPEAVSASYVSPILVTFSDGSELISSGAVTLTVKKSKPTLTVRTLTLNSYSSSHSAAPVFSGARVLSFTADALPYWLALTPDGKAFRIANGAESGNYQSKVRLTCTVDGWSWKPVVTVTINASSKAPSLKLSVSSVTLNPGTVDTAAVGYSVTDPTDTETDGSVSLGRIVEVVDRSTLPVENGAPITAELLPDTHTVLLRSAPTDGAAHTYRVYLTVGGREAGFITVKTAAAKVSAKLTLTQSGAVDTGVPQSMIVLTASPAYLHARGLGETYTVRILQTKRGTADKDVTDLFEITPLESGIFRIAELSTDSLLKKFSYYAVVDVDLNGDGIPDATAKIKLNVKHTPASRAKPSFKVKATGTIDPLRSGTKITLRLTVKNCYTYEPAAEHVHFYTVRGSKATPLEDPPFLVSVQNGTFVIRQKPGTQPNAGVSYAVRIECEVNGTAVVSNRVRLSVKQGKVKLTYTTASGTLLISDKYDTVKLHIGSSDTSLYGIRAVTMDSSLFTLTDLGNGDYCIGWKETTLRNRVINPKSGDTKTVTLSVFYEGNPTSKPNAKIRVKIRFAVDYGVSDKIIEYALTFLGTPYSKLDCSAFTKAVYSRFDRNICAGAHLQFTRVRTSTMWTYCPYSGGSIPAAALVFFSCPGCHCGRPHEIHHVAISLGDGNMVDSTDKPGINCVNIRPLDTPLTHSGMPMYIEGYAILND